jgi:DNA polymerase III gamma/tau subunit
MVIYRKYRPKAFGEMTGQEHIVQSLQNAIRLGRIGHAYLFTGPRGTGKTTLARIFAKSVNCETLRNAENTTVEPCNVCANCLDVNAGRSLDLIEIDAASHRGIDEVRELREGIKFAPAKARYKVFVIDECLTGDHLIMLADGRVKAIAELKDGEEVASIDLATGQIVPRRITHWFSRKTEELVTIRTPQATLTCTPTHHVWVMRNGGFHRVQARTVEKTDFLLSPLAVPHVTKNTLTPEQLSFLALIQCDGHIAKDSITIQVEIRKDVEYFINVFKKGVAAWGYPGTVSIRKTARGTTLLRCYSRELKETLMNLGCPSGRKGTLIDIPDEVFQAPLESIRAYIDACFCCEGDATALYQLNFSSTAKIFAIKLQVLLKKFGIASGLLEISRESKENHHTIYRVRLSGYDVRLFQNKIGLAIARKARILANQFLQKEKQDGVPIQLPLLARRKELDIRHAMLNSHGVYLDKTQAVTRSTLQEFIKIAGAFDFLPYLRFRYEKILEVTLRQESADVYDFTVEGTHTFVANGVCSSNCHQLTKEAFNALLKIIEEPPSHAIFILATTEPEKMLETILSRVVRFDFRRLKKDEILKRLTWIVGQEGMEIPPESYQLIVEEAEGSLRDAESLLEKILQIGEDISLEAVERALGAVSFTKIRELASSLFERDSRRAIEMLHRLVEEGGGEPRVILKGLTHYFRRTLLLSAVPELKQTFAQELSEDQLKGVMEHAASRPQAFSMKAIERFLWAEQALRWSPYPLIPVEMVVIEIASGQ